MNPDDSLDYSFMKLELANTAQKFVDAGCGPWEICDCLIVTCLRVLGCTDCNDEDIIEYLKHLGSDIYTKIAVSEVERIQKKKGLTPHKPYD